MKIAFIGDTHADARWACLCVQTAVENGADKLVQLGDFAYRDPHRKVFLENLDLTLENYDMELWWIDGNHDDHDILDYLHVGAFENKPIHTSSRTLHIPRGYRWEWDGVRYLACGGAYSIDKEWRVQKGPHKEWWPQEAITFENAETCLNPGPWGDVHADVMITHDVPWGVLNCYGPATGGGNKDQWPESSANRKLLRGIVDKVRPSTIFHGHCHNRYDEVLTLDDGFEISIIGVACNNMAGSMVMWDSNDQIDPSA